MITYCSLAVAAHLSGLSTSRARQFVRSGLVAPAVIERGRPLFGAMELARLRKIRRLTEDLGVNVAGVEVILRLTEEKQWQR